MKLRELMKELEISEDYIIEAAQKINMICKRCSCEECPFDTECGCVITTSADIRVDRVVKERIEKLLHPNRMKELAKLLDIELYNWFTATNTLGETSRYHLTKNGLYNDRGIAVPGLLTDLLIGKAYIVKEDKDE